MLAEQRESCVVDRVCSCDVTNNCAACQTVPICVKTFNNASINQGATYLYGNGSLGVFGNAVQKFGSEYAWLNSSFKQFYSSAAGVNRSNALPQLGLLSSAFANITNLTESMGNSTLFQYFGSIDLSSVCPAYSSDPLTAPWYCYAVGYCQNLNYNYSELSSLQASIGRLTSLPLSSSQLLQVAANTSSFERVYVYPLLSRMKLAQFSMMLNTTLRGYGAVVNGSIALLTHIRNATLQSDLSAMQSGYANTAANYVQANLTQANKTLGGQYAGLRAVYAKLNASYSSALLAASNNTAKILELQLSGGAPSAQLSGLAFSEFSLNQAVLASNISSIAALDTRLSGIGNQLSYYSTSPISLTEFARSADAPFIRGTASVLGLGYPDAV